MFFCFFPGYVRWFVYEIEMEMEMEEVDRMVLQGQVQVQVQHNVLHKQSSTVHISSREGVAIEQAV
eukprot:Gb_22078 [translate_table: standard]